MSLGRRSLWITIAATVMVALVSVYYLFDAYARREATELVNTVLKSEAAALQQGNLLASITKLQSSVNTSENLRGVAVYDLDLDPGLQFPLIKLGAVPMAPSSPAKAEIRFSLFNRMLSRTVNGNKVLTFYFQPDFLLWSYAVFCLLFIAFSFIIAFLAFRIEIIRSQERADALTYVWQQISHDIRSPLSALKIFSSVVARSGISNELILGAIQRIEGILEDLKQRSESKITEESFRLDIAVRQVVAEKGLEFADQPITIDGDFAFNIRGSQSHFKRVISNLLNNAIEASAVGQPILITSRRDGAQIRIEVIDKGRGIDTDVQPRLFKRGFTWGKTMGTGLGLYHARNVIHSLGGRLSLESTPNVGTRIRIDLNHTL